MIHKFIYTSENFSGLLIKSSGYHINMYFVFQVMSYFGQIKFVCIGDSVCDL